MRATSDFVNLPDESIMEVASVGVLDENFNIMSQQMDLIDSLFVNENEATE